MIKIFFRSGLLSGNLFNAAARGYDRRKDATSLTTQHISQAGISGRGRIPEYSSGIAKLTFIWRGTHNRGQELEDYSDQH